jgi:L-alanine-DL-glutamate epimerase-like enolase superfamily enzyme
VKVALELHEARLRAPLASARDVVSVQRLIVLGLENSDGVIGYGEAAPLAGYHDVTEADVITALEDCSRALASSDGRDLRQLLSVCAELTTVREALAAIDLALWDLAGKRVGLPVWRLLGATDAVPVEVNATIGALDRAGAAREAAVARAAGFGAVKVKVGVGDDAGRLAATRAASGREMRIRIDANGAWSVDEALAALRVLEPVGIECCEEPVHGLAEIEQVAAASAVPVSLDESATEPGALDRRRCAAVCLKIAGCGGISGLLRDAQRARASGYELYIASTLDGPLGIAAGLHAAAALSLQRPSGLATLALFADREDPLPPSCGTIAPPSGPGLGDRLIDWYPAPAQTR